MNRILNLFIYTLISILVINSNVVSQIQAIQNGGWNQATTWQNNTIPTANDVVEIPSGITVSLNNTAYANHILVSGKLKPATPSANFTLETKGVIVLNGGSLEIGTENQPYLGEGVFNLIGNDPNEDLMANMGTKLIGAMSGGTIDLHGRPTKTWTNLATTATAGETQFTLKEAVNWRVNDKIVLTSTNLDWNKVDECVITAISADKKTITVQTPLKYTHIGATRSYTRSTDNYTWDVNIYGEVALLTHNLTIKSDESSSTPGFGGHVMIMTGAFARVEHVELFQLGQKAKLARYPFHWHLVQDGGAGQYLRNSSIHKSYSRFVTIHGTDYVTVEGNVGYDHIGHGLFLEDGSEQYNTIKGNLIFMTRRPAVGEELTPSDNQFDIDQNRTPSSYWITNPHNTFEGNVAAGTEGTGFWFAMPSEPMGFSSGLPYFSGRNAQQQPLINNEFKNFTAHSCMNGFDIFDGLSPDHEIIINTGWVVDQPQYFTNGLFYANNQAIYTGHVGHLIAIARREADATDVRFKDCVISDNQYGSMLADDIIIENTLVNANSGLGINAHSATNQQVMFKHYDGPSTWINCHFTGWGEPGTKINIGRGGATTQINPLFINATKDVNEFIFEFWEEDIDPNSVPPRVSTFFKDPDGGFNGKAHTTIVPSHPFFLDGHEYSNPEWINAKRSDYYFSTMFADFRSEIYTGMTVVRTKPGTQRVYMHHLDTAHHPSIKQAAVINDEGFLYTVYFDFLPPSNRLNLDYFSSEKGSSCIFKFPGFGNLPNLGLMTLDPSDPLTRVYNYTDLETSTTDAYYLPGNGDLFIKRVRALDDRNQRQIIHLNWSDGSGYDTTYDTDGDGISDLTERSGCPSGKNPFDANDLSLEFNQSNEGFQKLNISASSESNTEYWLLRADNQIDPYIIKNGYNMDGYEISKIRIRVKSEVAGNYQFYWRNESENFKEANSKVISYNTPNVWQELVFDMTGHTGWEGHDITSLRIDFPGDATQSVHHYLDYIKGPPKNCDDKDPCTVNDRFDEYCKCIGDFLDSDGDGMCDGEESTQTPCRDINDPNDLLFHFNGTTDDFYISTAFHNVEPTANVLVLTSELQTQNNTIVKTNLGLNGNNLKMIKMRAKASISGTYRLFWKSTTDNWSMANSIIVNYTAPNWSDIVFDMTGHTGWEGKTITDLRFDLPKDQTKIIEHQIDYIAGPGKSCNDGDPCTVDDKYDTECNCKGVFNEFSPCEYNAQFVSQDIPAVMQACEKTTLKVSFKNIGSKTWTKPTTGWDFALTPGGTFEDKSWHVLPSQTNPGEIANFIFTVEPMNVGTYTLRFRILQRGVGRFGEVSPEVTIQVVDTTPPSFSYCPKDTTIYVGHDSCNARVSWTAPIASDNCAARIYSNLSPGDLFNLGQTEVEYIAVDTAGNSDTCSFIITVQDTAKPYIQCPNDTLIEIPGANTSATVVYPDPIVTDSCSNQVGFNLISGTASGGQFNLGTTTQVFEGVDSSNNKSAQCSFNVTLHHGDVNAQFIEVNISDTLYACEANSVEIKIKNTGIIKWTKPASGWDFALTPSGSFANQDPRWRSIPKEVLPGDTLTMVFDLLPKNVGSFDLRFQMLQSGVGKFGEISLNQSIYVIDTIPPSLSACPQDIVIELGPNQCKAQASWLEPNGTDNCNFQITGSHVNGSLFDLGKTKVEYMIVDSAGNYDSCSFYITVLDTTKPIIQNCPTNLLLNSRNNSCNAVASWIEPVITDNCSFNKTSNFLNGDTFNLGTTTVIYQASDLSGNTSYCQFEVNVIDDQAPKIACPNDTIVYTTGVDAVVFYNIPKASDNCEVDNVFLDQGLPSGSKFPLGANLIQFISTDSLGNSDSCSFTITVDKSLDQTNLTEDIIELFPNPTKGKLNVKVMQDGSYSLSIYNSLGASIISKFPIAGHTTINLPNELEPGVYFVQLEDANNITYMTRLNVIK